MKVLPWSFTSLDDFINCPRAFHAKRVIKTVKEGDTPHTIWGKRAHTAFEVRVRDQTPLDVDLQQHEPFMLIQASRPGQIDVEQRIALNRLLQPCGSFDPDVWFRGVIDYAAISGRVATLVDYKTGKPHSKDKQLKLFALWAFAKYPDVQMVHTMYYWTQTLTTTTKVYTRDQQYDMWRSFVPELKQYRDAFLSDIWQPRQSGLCRGYCPVTDCEFWRPRRSK